ncbi:MAG: HEPN domain-containing protein [Treponema sp.]|jgi:HEPN domain-containing protein|nr:HEPN domain-containing protein [Treponema sp.]
MHLKEIQEWFDIADDDLEAAKYLNTSHNPNFYIMYYHCSQCIEKYLKGYLVYNKVKFKFEHDLVYLNNECSKVDSEFEKLNTNCDIVTAGAKRIRYPNRVELKEEDIKYAMDLAEYIRNFDPIAKIKKVIEEQNTKGV